MVLIPLRYRKPETILKVFVVFQKSVNLIKSQAITYIKTFKREKKTQLIYTIIDRLVHIKHNIIVHFKDSNGRKNA